MGWGAANEDQFDRAQMQAYEAHGVIPIVSAGCATIIVRPLPMILN